MLAAYLNLIFFSNAIRLGNRSSAFAESPLRVIGVFISVLYVQAHDARMMVAYDETGSNPAA